jgi:hypothetical protein
MITTLKRLDSIKADADGTALDIFVRASANLVMSFGVCTDSAPKMRLGACMHACIHSSTPSSWILLSSPDATTEAKMKIIKECVDYEVYNGW